MPVFKINFPPVTDAEYRLTARNVNEAVKKARKMRLEELKDDALFANQIFLVDTQANVDIPQS